MSTNVKKKSTAGGGGKFSYKYTDLATIHEELEAQGITYYQYTEFDEKAQADYIYTVLIYKEGEESKPLRGVKIVDGNTLAGGNTAQQYGSALTYARRYSLLMALGWATEDDDAASAGAAPVKPQNQHYQGHTDGRLDFDQLKNWLAGINTIEEVMAAKEKCLQKYPDMTEKQRGAVDRIFSERTDQIQDGNDVPSNWIKR